MTRTPITGEASGDAIQMYARTAGVLGIISIVAGGFGEAYVPAALVVSRDAAATATKIMPKVIGILLALSGVGFVAKAFTWALAPSYSSPLLLMPAGIAALALTGWLLVKGVDAAKCSWSSLTGG